MTAGRKNIETNKNWNTPPKFINAIENLLGVIELDPCSNEYSFINANVKYILPTNGLLNDWNYKTIFVNPPYGRNYDKTTILNWIEKSVNAFHNGSEVLCLIPVATNTKHFKNYVFKYGTGICFLSDTRLKFYNNMNEDKKGSPMACCFVYFGLNYDKFNDIFSEFGKCLKI